MTETCENPLAPESATSPAPRLARKAMAAREQRIIRLLTAGVNAAEIARREGLSLRRMQQLTKAIFARRRDALPEHFVELQTTRLQEALVVSFGAMGGGNLGAVDRVVKIVRELDRYHGFTARDLRPLAGEAKQIASQVLDGLQSGETGQPALALSGPSAAPLALTPIHQERPVGPGR